MLAVFLGAESTLVAQLDGEDVGVVVSDADLAELTRISGELRLRTLKPIQSRQEHRMLSEYVQLLELPWSRSHMHRIHCVLCNGVLHSSARKLLCPLLL